MPLKQHPTKPDMMIYTKTEYGNISIDDDYERGFIDGMQKQMQSSVDKAVNAMSKKEWVGLTDEDCEEVERWIEFKEDGNGRIPTLKLIRYIEAKLKEKNSG